MTKNVTENKGGLTGDQRAGNPYQSTVYGCFAGYIVQAIVNNLAPLLFLTFQSEYRIGLEKITLLITLNFCTQLIVDLVSVKFVDRIGYRISLILAHGFAAAGLAGLAFLPDLLADPFAGLAVCAAVYAVGGGLLEVLVSPVVEACPSDRKEAAMSLLHSFYCWGQVGVVLISTLYFALAGVGRWRALALIWALLPLGNGIRFFRLPLPRELTAQESGISLRELLGRRLLWILLLMMACAGAGERSGSEQDGGGSGRPHAVCAADGKRQGLVRKVRCRDPSGEVYGCLRSAVPDQLRPGRPLPLAGGLLGRLRTLRAFRGNFMAGHLQPCGGQA